MTLQRRLILAVLLAAPLAWLLTMAATYWSFAHEVNEFYDTNMVHMARQMRVAAPLMMSKAAPDPAASSERHGATDFGDLAVAIWQPDGRQLLATEGVSFPILGTDGFVNIKLNGQTWRIYYLSEPDSGARVAVGQRLGERNDLILTYVSGQILPWLIGLPVLIGLLILAVRKALRPVRALSMALERRMPDDARPLRIEDTPAELHPLIQAMNGLLVRVAAMIEQERRLTADAAHELRTPLAALKAQWNLARKTPEAQEREEAFESVDRGIARLERLVSQLLTMARLDSARQTLLSGIVDWRVVAEQAIADCLWLADRRDVELEVRWPPSPSDALPIVGDNEAMTILLKNLLENAIRYGAAHAVVRIIFAPNHIAVDDQGAGVSAEIMQRLGDRFFRAPGQAEPGSGLGLSISEHIAHSHGLSLRFENRSVDDGFGAGLRVLILRSRMAYQGWGRGANH